MRNPLLAFLPAFLLLACSGPRPEVSAIELKAGSEKDSYLVAARISNRSGGEGEVSVSAKLVDRKSGIAYEHEEKLTMKPHEKYGVELEVHAPAGDFEPKVEVTYPPGK